MMSARENRKASHLVQYFAHLEPVDESEVLVVPMKSYGRVLSLPWCKARNPEIDWTNGRLTVMQTPNGLQWAKIAAADRASAQPERGE
jgi:hypothetical protein